MRRYVKIYEDFTNSRLEDKLKELELELKNVEDKTFGEKIRIIREINSIKKQLGIKTDAEIKTEKEAKIKEQLRKDSEFCKRQIKKFFAGKIDINIHELPNGANPSNYYRVYPPLFRGQKDIKNGTSENGGMAMYGNGLYTTTSRKYASTYGKVIRYDAYSFDDVFPKNAVYFDNLNHFNQFEHYFAKALFGNRGGKSDLFNDNVGNIDKYLIQLGYNGVVIKEHDGVTVIIKYK